MAATHHTLVRIEAAHAKVYCAQCHHYRLGRPVSQTCDHPHAQTIGDSWDQPQVRWAGAATRNADNDCPDFLRYHVSLKHQEVCAMVGAFSVTLLAALTLMCHVMGG